MLKTPLLAWVLVLLVAPLGRALDRAALAVAKQATVLVEGAKPGEIRGSAVCIHPFGYFIAGARAVEGLDPKEIRLVLNPGTQNQRTAVAEVIRVDRALGLAFLSGGGPKELFPALPLADPSTLMETMEVTALGYSLPTDTSIGEEAELPGLAVHQGRVIRLGAQEGHSSEVHANMPVSPGMEGGALVNEAGELAGVILGATRDGKDLAALHIGKALAFALAPRIVADEPIRIAWKERFTPRVFSVKLLRDHGDLDLGLVMDVRLLLEDPGGRRSLRMTEASPGLWQAEASPLMERSSPDLAPLRFTFVFDGESVTGSRMADRSLTLGGQDLWLGEILSIKPEWDSQVVETVYGTRWKGKAQWPEWELTVAEQALRVPAHRVRGMTRSEKPAIQTPAARVDVRLGGFPSATFELPLELADIPGEVSISPSEGP